MNQVNNLMFLPHLFGLAKRMKMNAKLQNGRFQMPRLGNSELNLINLICSILVLGTGLLLFLKYHIGDGAFRNEYLGLEKKVWMFIHQASAVIFIAGFVLHILAHWNYLARVVGKWRSGLRSSIKIRISEQVLLLGVLMIVAWAGFFPWLTMPGATLKVAAYHSWIDIHTRVGLFLLIGMSIHIVRRWPRIFKLRVRGDRAKPRKMETSETQMTNRNKKAKTKRSKNRSTKFIIADTSRCEACWKCIDECDFNVLRKLNILIHKHVIVKNAEACRGCLKCVAVCPNGALQPLSTATPSRS